jgi:hypothetical protein
MNEFQEFIDEMIKQISKAVGIPYEMMRIVINSPSGYIDETFLIYVAINDMRVYTQTGPWADMLNEVI